MKRIGVALGSVFLILGVTASNAQDGELPGGDGVDQPWMNTALTPAERTEALIAAMTLEQKIQQIYNRKRPAEAVLTITRRRRFDRRVLRRYSTAEAR